MQRQALVLVYCSIGLHILSIVVNINVTPLFHFLSHSKGLWRWPGGPPLPADVESGPEKMTSSVQMFQLRHPGLLMFKLLRHLNSGSRV